MTKIITCECGSIIRGNSEINALANLRLHTQSKKHKELIKLKKVLQHGLKRKSEISILKGEGAQND